VEWRRNGRGEKVRGGVTQGEGGRGRREAGGRGEDEGVVVENVNKRW